MAERGRAHPRPSLPQGDPNRFGSKGDHQSLRLLLPLPLPLPRPPLQRRLLGPTRRRLGLPQIVDSFALLVALLPRTNLGRPVQDRHRGPPREDAREGEGGREAPREVRRGAEEEGHRIRFAEGGRRAAPGKESPSRGETREEVVR